MFIIVTLVTVYVGGSVEDKEKRHKKANASAKEVRLALGARTSHRKNYAIQLHFKNE